MIVSHPLVLFLLAPAVAAFAWCARHGDRYIARLPGDWERLVAPSLRATVGRLATQGAAPQLLGFLALWVVLVIAIARPAWELEEAANFSNIAGRVIAMDLGGGADIHSQRLAATTLIDSAPDVPTALVVGSGDAFNVVPLTTDRNFIDRYLNVITPDVMPLDGQAISVTVAHSEAILTRAGVVVGQVILLAGGEPPPGMASWQGARIPCSRPPSPRPRPNSEGRSDPKGSGRLKRREPPARLDASLSVGEHTCRQQHPRQSSGKTQRPKNIRQRYKTLRPEAQQHKKANGLCPLQNTAREIKGLHSSRRSLHVMLFRKHGIAEKARTIGVEAAQEKRPGQAIDLWCQRHKPQRHSTVKDKITYDIKIAAKVARRMTSGHRTVQTIRQP